MSIADFTIEAVEGDLQFFASGIWRAQEVAKIDSQLRSFEDDSIGRDLVIDVSGVEQMDTAGAMALQRVMRACTVRTERSAIIGASKNHKDVLEQVAMHLAPCPVEPIRGNPLMMMTERLGKGVVNVYFASLEILSFIGLTLATIGRVLAVPGRLRGAATFHHMEEAGLNAFPIVGLMSFLIGAVVAFMGAKILQAFNADIFTVELVGIAVMREFGVLLAAILVAGRSGSAFTAQIGSMKIREEIDAMKTLGLDPIEVLVVPRVIALVVMLPVLAFLGAVLGLIGGGLVAWLSMNISPALFMARMQETLVVQHFWSGIIKAPFFAFVIGVVGCFQGMEVGGSAESLGQRTTLSVVQSLFLVIVLDAFFAMFFLEINF